MQEHEKKIMPWLWCFAAFIVFRFFALLFFSIVNDLIFAYNVLMTLIWCLIIPASIYGWLTVYSLYIELADLTKLEDLAHLRVSFFYGTKHVAQQFLYKSFPYFRWAQCNHSMHPQLILWLDHVQSHLTRPL